MDVNKFDLRKDNSLLLIIDVQEKFLPHIDKSESLVRRINILMKAALKLGIPMLMTEQYPKGLGPTNPNLLQNYDSKNIIQKDTFSCMGEPLFVKKLTEIGRKHILVAGIETHVCVLQTALDLLKDGYVVHIARDCVRSRHPQNRRSAMDMMRGAGAVITCMETAVFQWLERSDTKEFKEVQPWVK